MKGRKNLEDCQENEKFYQTICGNSERAIKRIENFTKSAEFKNSDHFIVNIKLELLEDSYKKFALYNDGLLAANPQSDTAEIMENLFIDLKAKLQRRLEVLCTLENNTPGNDKKCEKSNNNQNQQVCTNTHFHFTLPTFAGYNDNFKTFMEAFTAQVGDNDKLTGKQKMYLLKSCLTGSALDSVSQDGTNNYDDVLEILNSRFANKQYCDSLVGKHELIVESTKEIHNSVVCGAYDRAIEVCKDLQAKGQGHVITQAVTEMAKKNDRNLLSFIYKLWNGGERNIVIEYMPWPFKGIFDNENVILEDKQYGLALKLDVNKNKDNDRVAWGDSKDKTSARVIWNLIPIWENNNVFFKFKNVDVDMVLKLGQVPNKVGDRGVFGTIDKAIETRTWFWLMPVYVEGEYLFIIVNKDFNQVLRLSNEVDSYKDRNLWGSQLVGLATRYAWNIKKHVPAN